MLFLVLFTYMIEIYLPNEWSWLSFFVEIPLLALVKPLDVLGLLSAL